MLIEIGPNCALIHDLSFCSDVAYAVPSNLTLANDTAALGVVYDNYTSDMYQNFNKSLQQIPCNTTASAQYSLAVNCTDCAHAYKDWLCAVTIPRCEDFSNEADYLQPRAVGYDFIGDYVGKFNGNPSLSPVNKALRYTNQSRSQHIDDVIRPGPYKELLPCEDLCYGLVRSCPAALGFSCPLEGHGLNYSYGKPKPAGRDLSTCNFPGRASNVAVTLQRANPFATSMVIITVSFLLLGL